MPIIRSSTSAEGSEQSHNNRQCVDDFHKDHYARATIESHSESDISKSISTFSKDLIKVEVINQSENLKIVTKMKSINFRFKSP